MKAHNRRYRLGDEENRRRWQNPEAILADIGLKPGLTFIDVGCNEGFFSLPAARMVGETGRVYGIDLDSGAVDRLKEKAAREGLTNLTLKVGKAEEIVLEQVAGDIVFFGQALHDFEDPASVLVNAGKMLKPTGRLVDLDWKKVAGTFGPPLDIRFSAEEAGRLIEAAGFRIDSVRDVIPHHYIITARYVING